jgi:hypothetical protein
MILTVFLEKWFVHEIRVVKTFSQAREQLAKRLDCGDSSALFIRAKAALKPPQSKRSAT